MGINGRTWRQRQKKLCGNKPISLAEKPEYIALFKWAKKNGVIFDKMKPALFPGIGRGLMATGKIEIGKSLISVPKHLLITRDMIRQRYFPGQLLKSDISTIDLLCLFLIIENSFRSDSFWFPYIAMLPKVFTTPSYFSVTELKIVPPFFTDHCRVQLKDVQKCLGNLKQLVNCVAMETRKNIDITFESVRWAWNVVNTRSVYVDYGSNVVGDGTKSYGLAPLLDLLNHSCDVEVQAGFSQAAAKYYDIQTKTRFEKGSQVFINYGPHSNRKLLVEYGFILPSNCHNSIRIEPTDVYDIIYESNGNSLSAEKYNIITKYHLEETYSCLCGGLSWSLVTALKIIALDDAKLVKRAVNIEDIPLSAEDQHVIMLFSRNILKSLLGKYDSHLERIRCRLDNGPDSSSQDRINAVIALLRQEREIVRNNFEVLKQ